MALFVLLTGCEQNTGDPDKVRTDTFKVTVKLTDEVVYKGERVSGLAIWKDDWCIIQLPKDEYPRCLAHEMRHCLEGDFHEGYRSYEDCTD